MMIYDLKCLNGSSDKFWKLKDTYISTPIKSGNYWGIKKYNILVNPTIDKNTIKSINNFNLC